MTLDPCFVDVYPGDGAKDWAAYISAGPPWHGAIFKLTQGTDYAYPQWAAAQRNAFVASPRYGHDLFDGFYHYLTFNQDGTAQAEHFWSNMQRIGGELAGTLWAMVDVERGGQRIANPSRQQVEDATRGFAERYEQLSGRTPTLYGGELLRACGIQGRLGCGRSAIALYSAVLPGSIVQRTGTDLEHLMFWQYRGTSPQKLGPAGYPMTAPGCGDVDISALVLPGGLDALRSNL